MADNYNRFSPYCYVVNNPIKLYDPNGMWPAAVHDRMIREAFGGTISQDQFVVLSLASRYADKGEFQTINNSFRHAMTPAGWSQSTAQNYYNNFISDQFLKAVSLGSTDQALFQLGIAFHAIMDNSSPTHKGFQDWKGLANMEAFGLVHSLGEGEEEYESDEAQPEDCIKKPGTMPGFTLYFLAQVK